MYWQRWSDRLKGELGLATEPVAVTFAGAPAPSGPVPHGKASVCQALKRASEGECIAISVETCGCPGGLVSLGLGQLPPDGKERLVEFLVEKEKVYCSRAALHRGQGIVPAPAGAASQVVFSPLAKATLQPRPRGVHRPAGLPPPPHQHHARPRLWGRWLVRREARGGRTSDRRVRQGRGCVRD